MDLCTICSAWAVSCARALQDSSSQPWVILLRVLWATWKKNSRSGMNRAHWTSSFSRVTNWDLITAFACQNFRRDLCWSLNIDGPLKGSGAGPGRAGLTKEGKENCCFSRLNKPQNPFVSRGRIFPYYRLRGFFLGGGGKGSEERNACRERRSSFCSKITCEPNFSFLLLPLLSCSPEERISFDMFIMNI